MPASIIEALRAQLPDHAHEFLTPRHTVRWSTPSGVWEVEGSEDGSGLPVQVAGYCCGELNAGVYMRLPGVTPDQVLAILRTLGALEPAEPASTCGGGCSS